MKTIFAIPLTIAIVVLVPSGAFAQAAQANKPWTPPKTPWGEPDLQGQWPATANIPMQRPASFGTRATLTDEELAQRERQAERQNESDTQEFATASRGLSLGGSGDLV